MSVSKHWGELKNNSNIYIFESIIKNEIKKKNYL